MQQAQRKLCYSALHIAPPARSRTPDPWPTLETVGDLIEFYSAQWGHLRAFDDTDRWLRSLPAAPYEERIEELRRLHAQLLETAPPGAAQALGDVLKDTLELAAKFAARREHAWEDKKLLAQMHAHLEALSEAKNEFIVVESKLSGPVPPIPATSAPDGVRRID